MKRRNAARPMADDPTERAAATQADRAEAALEAAHRHRWRDIIMAVCVGVYGATVFGGALRVILTGSIDAGFKDLIALMPAVALVYYLSRRGAHPSPSCDDGRISRP